MTLRLTAYDVAERLIGRAALWKLGRYLYSGARRELTGDPSRNGEYALQRWYLAVSEHEASGKKIDVVDAGGFRGDWTATFRAAAADARTAVRVIVFEPAPRLRAALRERFGPEIRIGDIAVDGRALSSQAVGKRSFHVVANDGGTNGLAPQPGDSVVSVVEVNLATVDTLLPEYAIEELGFLKIDAEGHDAAVLQGAKKTLATGRLHVAQFEYNWRWARSGYTLSTVFELVGGMPYVLARVTSRGLEAYETWHPELERFLETNFAVVREDYFTQLPHQMVRFNCANLPQTVALGNGTRRE